MTRSIPIPHTHAVNNKKSETLKCPVDIFKSRLRVIGTEKWNRVMTVLVGYPDTFLVFFCCFLTLLCTVHLPWNCQTFQNIFKFARLKGFERLENCLTKGTYERF